MSGYRVVDGIFLDSSWKNYLCCICKLLLKNAVQPLCGHRLCESCAEEIYHDEVTKKAVARCPKKDCGEKLRGENGIKYFPDRCARREVSELQVCCLLKKCGWMGKFKQYEEHMKCEHPSYKVQPVELAKASHVVVDKKLLEDTASSQHDMKKLQMDILHREEELKEIRKRFIHECERYSHVMTTQLEKSEPVTRVSPTGRVESAAQSTSSLGRAGEQDPSERSSTWNADRSDPARLPHLEVQPHVEAVPQASKNTSKAQMVIGTDAATTNNSIKETVVLRHQRRKSGSPKASSHSPSPPPLPPRNQPHDTPPNPPIRCTSPTTSSYLPPLPPRPLLPHIDSGSNGPPGGPQVTPNLPEIPPRPQVVQRMPPSSPTGHDPATFVTLSDKTNSNQQKHSCVCCFKCRCSKMIHKMLNRPHDCHAYCAQLERMISRQNSNSDDD